MGPEWVQTPDGRGAMHCLRAMRTRQGPALRGYFIIIELNAELSYDCVPIGSIRNP